jgi:hypothetical protein
MKNASVLIEVRGGVVVAVYSNDPQSRVFLLDWDEAGNRIRRDSVDAGRYPVDSFDAMPADTAKLFLNVTSDQNARGH